MLAKHPKPTRPPWLRPCPLMQSSSWVLGKQKGFVFQGHHIPIRNHQILSLITKINGHAYSCKVQKSLSLSSRLNFSSHRCHWKLMFNVNIYGWKKLQFSNVELARSLIFTSGTHTESTLWNLWFLLSKETPDAKFFTLIQEEICCLWFLIWERRRGFFFFSQILRNN